MLTLQAEIINKDKYQALWPISTLTASPLLNAVHPGIILKDALDNRGMSQKELADAVGKSTPVINDIIKGKRGINAEPGSIIRIRLRRESRRMDELPKPI